MMSETTETNWTRYGKTRTNDGQNKQKKFLKRYAQPRSLLHSLPHSQLQRQPQRQLFS